MHENIKKIFQTSTIVRLILSQNKRKITSNQSHTIYSLQDAGTFLNILNAEASGEKEVRVRFLVDTAGQLWLARERNEDSSKERLNPSPAHFMLTGETGSSARCLTAGTFYFNLEQNQLIKIDNKSGDFKPDFNSLKWALLILMRTQNLSFHLPETLKIEDSCVYDYEVPLGDIRNWADTVAAKTKVVSQNHCTKNVHYEKYAPRATVRQNSPLSTQNGLFRSPETDENTSSARRILFTNDVETPLLSSETSPKAFSEKGLGNRGGFFKRLPQKRSISDTDFQEENDKTSPIKYLQF